MTANKSKLPLAKNAVRKLRTLRHPGIVKVLETVEVKDKRDGNKMKFAHVKHRPKPIFMSPLRG